MQERRAVVAPLRSGEGTPPVRSRRGWALILGVAAAVVVVDQLTKTWALHHLRDGPRHVVWTLRFNLTFNTGIAFSQASGSTAVVTVIALVVVALLLVIARRTGGALTGVVLGLVIGGAVGNLLDRLVRHHGGAVIDFIDLQWWPVFNVADAAITIGVVIALVRAVLGPSRGRAEAA
ncbi:MAG TPA: signal peptidase II [Acidimicrobiales bacterium]|nr:signal peptidase II [Acidimicrobiales bacterium]